MYKVPCALQYPDSFGHIWIIHYPTEGKGSSWQWESRGRKREKEANVNPQLCSVTMMRTFSYNTALPLYVFAARPVHIPDLSCLQELNARQLLVLVSLFIVLFHLEKKRIWLLFLWRMCVCVCANLHFFLRYVIVECEDQDTQQRDPKTHEMYLNVMRRFSQALLKVRIWICSCFTTDWRCYAI